MVLVVLTVWSPSRELEYDKGTMSLHCHNQTSAPPDMTLTIARILNPTNKTEVGSLDGYHTMC